MPSRALTSSLWARELEGSYPPLNDSRAADVVVVGAGIAGLVTATLLQQSGHDVVVIDRDIVGGVATRNTTAKVTALQGTTLSKIRQTRNASTARRYARAQADAVDGLRTLIDTSAIDCEMTPATALTFAFEDDASTRVNDEFDAATEAGLPVTRESSTDLPFETATAIGLANQFHIDPAALCRALAGRLGPNHIFEHTAAVDIDDRDGSDCVIKTEHGHELRSRHTVIATQSPIFDPMLVANRCRPMQSYALAVRTSTELPESMSIAADDFTISLRPATVDGQRYLIVGGNGHPVGEPAGEDRWTTLEQWAQQHLDGVEIVRRWATHDLVATDHVPFIGRMSPSSRGCWIATAFGKWGMTNAYVAAKILCDFIDEKEPPKWAATFDSTRIGTTINRNFVTAGATAMHHLVADRVTNRKEPRCTHQGCVLRKDEALDSWDCPCHGSRFDADGKVLQGPAIRSLASPGDDG